MFKQIQYAKYDKKIKQMKRNRNLASAMLISAVVLIIIFSFPLDLEPVLPIRYDGLGIGLGIFMFVVSYIVYIFALGYILLPINNAMSVEGDPEKHLVLASAFFKGTNLDYVCMSSLYALGVYDEALPYAIMLSENKSKKLSLDGYFYKFRCEFFKGEYAKSRISAKAYESVLNDERKLSPKVQANYEKVLTAIHFMLALENNDTEAQGQLISRLAPWSESVGVHGFVNYLKGVYAYNINDLNEAIYRFKQVTENHSKLILSTYASDYLERIKEKTNS